MVSQTLGKWEFIYFETDESVINIKCGAPEEAERVLPPCQ